MAASASPAQQGPPWSTVAGRLDGRLLKGLENMGYRSMTPVQYKVLTELPTLRSDCLVQAKTGTGKTIAFLLPTLHTLLNQPPLPRGKVAILIISPTRELALQIAKEYSSLTAHFHPRLECHTAYGGTSKNRELRKFCDGDPKVLVATPGRLTDYLSDPSIAQMFTDLRTLILDEADQMLETGFLPAIKEILRALPPKSRNWQGMCFSATIPKKIESVLPLVLRPDATRISTVDPDEIPTIDQAIQHYITVPTVADVYPMLLSILKKEYARSPNDFKAIVFGTTANGVNLMHSLFSAILPHTEGMRVFQLQSRLSQNARTRTTNEFKEASAGVMFASDVIGRGMDFPNVSLVLQVGIPSNSDQYVHRVGRTARAGSGGRAVILLTQRESFFLQTNKRLPITSYPDDLSSTTPTDRQTVFTSFHSVDPETKSKAYQAWLGFHKAFTKPLGLSNEALVQLANDYAAALDCAEPPAIEKRVVGKMGLKGVRGLNVVSGERVPNHSAKPQNEQTSTVRSGPPHEMAAFSAPQTEQAPATGRVGELQRKGRNESPARQGGRSNSRKRFKRGGMAQRGGGGGGGRGREGGTFT